MNRREVLGAVAAVFCGVLLPEPMRETIKIASLGEHWWAWDEVNQTVWDLGGENYTSAADALLKTVYQDVVTQSRVIDRYWIALGTP